MANENTSWGQRVDNFFGAVFKTVCFTALICAGLLATMRFAPVDNVAMELLFKAANVETLREAKDNATDAEAGKAGTEAEKKIKPVESTDESE